MNPLRRYLRTPKGLLIAAFPLLLLPAMWHAGPARTALTLGVAVAAAAVLDALILRGRKGRWVFPDGAILTALIVGMVLSPFEPWWVAAVSTCAGVSAKYLVRARNANTFNPAALALVLASLAFHSGQSWWGSLAELPAGWVALLVAVGVVVADRVKKLPSAIAFLGTYFLLFTLSAFVGNPAPVAEIFRAPDAHAALFFAFFMVTDPPTSPPRERDQLMFGIATGALTWAAFTFIGAVWWLPGGLLVANAVESVRRVREWTRRAANVRHA